MESLNIALDNFQGPLELLFQLIQKKEMDIYEVPIEKVIAQFLPFLRDGHSLDAGAEFVGYASSLILLKSRALLPSEEQKELQIEASEDPFSEMIYHLIDYCKFKQAAKILNEKNEKCADSFFRGASLSDAHVKKNLGIEHLTLDDIASLFQDVLSRASSRRGTIEDELFKVSDKIAFVKESLSKRGRLLFQDLFSENLSKEELIVTFLAMLELMKHGELKVIKEQGEILVVRTHE